MNGISILNKIIENDGSCTKWADKAICEACPLSKLKKKADGTYFSCIEAIGAEDMSESKADARYKEIASRLLLDHAIEEILGECDGIIKQ